MRRETLQEPGAPAVPAPLAGHLEALPAPPPPVPASETPIGRSQGCETEREARLATVPFVSAGKQRWAPELDAAPSSSTLEFGDAGKSCAGKRRPAADGGGGQYRRNRREEHSCKEIAENGVKVQEPGEHHPPLSGGDGDAKPRGGKGDDQHVRDHGVGKTGGEPTHRQTRRYSPPLFRQADRSSGKGDEWHKEQCIKRSHSWSLIHFLHCLAKKASKMAKPKFPLSFPRCVKEILEYLEKCSVKIFVLRCGRILKLKP